jgi:hypothetical protein
MELDLNAPDFVELELLRNLLRDFGDKSSDCDVTYGLISDVLLANVEMLKLDEDLYNLTRFAIGLTSEISPLLLSRESLGIRHWAWRPVYTKVGGKNSPASDIRPRVKQVASMMRAFAVQLPRDPMYADGAEALERYILLNHLWTEQDDHIEY